jgi:hypothetical protein
MKKKEISKEKRGRKVEWKTKGGREIERKSLNSTQECSSWVPVAQAYNPSYSGGL